MKTSSLKLQIRNHIAIVCIALTGFTASQSQAQQAGQQAAPQATPQATPAPVPREVAIENPTRTNTAIIPNLNQGFQTKHRANVAIAEKGDIDVLFMGDSITDFWRNPTGNYAGKPVFDKYFGEMKVANFGIAGDTTQGVLFRLQNGEGKGFKPKAIMLMIGTNNNGRNTPPEIAEGIGAITLEMKKDFPDAKILLLGVFPRSTATNQLRTAIADINKRIAKLHDGKTVTYLDIGEKFLDAEGNISREIMSDGLHPTGKGYEIWAEAVKEPLAKLISNK